MSSHNHCFAMKEIWMELSLHSLKLSIKLFQVEVILHRSAHVSICQIMNPHSPMRSKQFASPGCGCTVPHEPQKNASRKVSGLTLQDQH